MEARRTFETGARSSKQIWIVFAALLAALVLALGGAYVAKGLTSASAPPSSPLVVQPGGFQGSHHAPARAPKVTVRSAPGSPAHSVRYRVQSN
jgi:hypothetical protein